MALKTFNIDEQVYKQFSKHCKSEGLSMSKKVEKFIAKELEGIKNLSSQEGIKDKVEEERQRRIKDDNDQHPLMKYC